MKSPLCEDDRVFLGRLQPLKRRVTFAHYILDEIRGQKRTNSDDIVRAVADRLRLSLARTGYPRDPDQEQWLAVLEAYPDEARRCVAWYLAWEQRSKIEKRAVKWRQYQAYLRSKEPSAW